MTVPAHPKIYHIVHVDRLNSILNDGALLSDAVIVQRGPSGTTIGMNHIKGRRLNELQLISHPGLFVGQCIPFNFCPRSVMLFLIYKGNAPDLTYKDGQEPIIHLEADLHKTVSWARINHLRWVFTLTNAGSRFFEDRADLQNLAELDWDAIAATKWQMCKEGKQAEFLIEQRFPWELVERIGVYSDRVQRLVNQAIRMATHKPVVFKNPAWYY